MSKITMTDSRLIVEPFPQSLKEELKYFRRKLVFDPATHRRELKGNYEQLWFNDDDCTYTFPGFAHRVLVHLRRLGNCIEFSDKRTPLPKPDIEKAFEGLREYQKEVVYKALKSCGGIICAPTGYGKTAIAAKIISAFDPEELKIRGTPLCLFACPDKDINAKNRESLEKFLPGRDVGCLMSGCNHMSDDVTCITLDSLHRVDPCKVGILIVDEMHTAASDSRAEELVKFTKALKWGVSATPTGRFDGKDIVSEGIFGPVVVHKTYSDGVACGALVPIKVFWVHTKEPQCGIARYNSYKTREKKLEIGHMCNFSTNSMIAEILRRQPESMQTLVMTQFVEHINNIIQRCDDDVRYVHAQTSEDSMSKYSIGPVSTKERKEIYEKMRDGEIRKIVSTFIYKQGADFPKLDIVINAAGGGSDILAHQIPGRASRKVDGKDVAYMIDFWHEWDTSINPDTGRRKWGPLLCNDKQRKNTYEELGFEQTWVRNIDEIPFLCKNEC